MNPLLPQLKQVEQVLKKNCQHYEIIICDDKSTDSSAKLLKKNFAHNPKYWLIFHNKNEGIARTIKHLYNLTNYSIVILFSVDGDWNPKDIGKLLTSAIRNNADIVIGKRQTKRVHTL